ncbi:MAG: TIGR04283 family arsenosugar biosynthesis glycosyltransferase [Gammaproteobacteria bacterium]|jgi:rSAM/selenodomain-associated transferase 2
MKAHPSLSVIIPVLNEAGQLPHLLDDLSRQQYPPLEIIVVDGGSHDGTLAACESFKNKTSLELKMLSSEPGRARQMNTGARAAAASEYLFLHADTRIDNTGLLKQAHQCMENARRHHGHTRIAGHFPLRFVRDNDSAVYYFYECKTRLNRPDCINGDQGFWLAKDYFDGLGGFDESLPYMEDAKLSARIFNTGHWITLPGELTTSARRFEAEGFTRRQIINSFLCNFNAMGVDDFFHWALDAYRSQDKTRKLDMKPLLKLAHRQMNGDGIKVALQRWYQTGAYIAGNAWQLAFALDCRRQRKRGMASGHPDTRYLAFYDRHLATIANWPVIKALTALITIIWFYSLFITQ